LHRIPEVSRLRTHWLKHYRLGTLKLQTFGIGRQRPILFFTRQCTDTLFGTVSGSEFMRRSTREFQNMITISLSSCLSIKPPMFSSLRSSAKSNERKVFSSEKLRLSNVPTMSQYDQRTHFPALFFIAVLNF
jgi:hypothetical protein